MKITGFKIKGFCGSNALWDYVMDNASLRSYITHHDQSGLSRPNHKGERGENDNIHNNIHNVVNINRAINDNIYAWGFLTGPIPMELHGG